MSSSKEAGGGGLSVETLAIASVSSLAAAFFLHTYWQGGAILGAAVTPVIVAIVSETLRKPAQVVKARTGRTTDQAAVEPPPVVAPDREDRFGIWEDQKQRAPRRKIHLGLAIATGLAAFVIAAFFLTGAELIFGDASSTDRFRVLPGKQQKKDSGSDSPSTTTTEPQETEPAPEEEEPVPEETVPEPVPPAETTPETTPVVPPETQPVPAPGTTTPVP